MPRSLLAALLLALAAPCAGAQSFACTSTGPAGRAITDYLRALVQANDTASAGVRTAFGVTAGRASDVQPVLDEATCRRAALAYYRDRLGPPQTSIALVRVGTVYAAIGQSRCGERSMLVIYSARFEPLSYICQ